MWIYIYAPLTREKTVYEKGCKGNMEISVGGRFSAFNKSYDWKSAFEM
jgi:hypothetical protein